MIIFEYTLVVIFCLIGALLATSNPGFRVAITNNGFSYINKVAVPILEEDLGSLKIPDKSGRERPFDYWLSRVELTEFNINSSEIITDNSTGVTGQAHKVTIRAKGHWHWRLDFWPHVSDTGDMDISLSEVALTTTVKIEEVADGKVGIKPIYCLLGVHKMDIKFHGSSMKQFYDLFVKIAESDIRESIKKEVCKAAFSTIVSKVSYALDSLPFVFKIGDGFELSYQLLSDPTFSNQLVYTLHRGEFLSIANSVDAPFKPSPLPPVTNANRMMYLWITDYVANTAGLVFQRAGVLQYNIKPDMVPKDFPLQLNTSYFRIIVPSLYTHFPNMKMQIYVNSTKQPWLQVTKNNASFTVSGTVRVDVILPNKTKVNAFTLELTVHTNAFVWIKQIDKKPVISANCSINRTKFNFHLISTNIGYFDVELLQDGINLLVEAVIIPLINKYGNDGLMLPIIDGLSFINPKVSLLQGYALVDTDFHYVPQQ